MSDNYGSALDQMSFGAQPGGAPQNSAPMDLAPPAEAASPAPQPAAPPTFGSSLRNMLPGPHYDAPDPASSALDQSANLIDQRVKRATDIATNPWAQIFAPEQVAAARDFVPKAVEQLQKIQQQRQQQVDIQKAATNYGIPKSAQNPYMTGDTIDNWLLDQYKAGDFSAAKKLQARGKGEWVQDFVGDAVDGAGARLAAANTAITKLSAAGNDQGAYAAAFRALTPEDKQAITALGLQTIPEKASDWQDLVQKHGAAFAQAQQTYLQARRGLTNITNFDGTVPKDVETASQGDIRIGSSNEPATFPVRTRQVDGQTGHVGPNGSVQMEKYGLAPKNGGWSATTAERLEKNDKMLAGEDVKGAVNQYNIANKFKNEALNEATYTSSAGLALLKDTLGGVGRDVAEKSAAAGTTGLSQMFSKQQGGIEGFINTATNEINALRNWIDGGKKGDRPRISEETKRGVQFIANENYKYAQEQAGGRLSGAMRYAGQIGRPLEDMPLDAELKNSVASYHEEGRADAINGWRSYPSLVRGNQRIFFPQGSNVNGANPPRPPLSAPDDVQQPQQPSPVTPQRQAGGVQQPGPSPLSPQPGGPGSPPAVQPVRVAGLDVNMPLPQGVSPAYVQSMQRIESGNERSPWTSTTKGSTASGAFQFLDSTWKENRPAGAPDRAKDATPEQQAQALATLTAKNSASLQANRLPVTDSNLYIMHNLGAGGGATLLHATPGADARTVVGEAAARNNPMFFKGRPTVATVLQRYADAMAGGNAAQPDAAPDRSTILGALGSAVLKSFPGTAPAAYIWDRLSPEQKQTVKDFAVEEAPMIGGVAGNVAGGALGAFGGPPGALAGGVAAGAAGGAAGQAFKDWMQGEQPSVPKYAGAAGWGAVGGIAPGGPAASTAARVAATGARIAGSGAVSATVKAMEGGDATDITIAGAAGAAGGVLGEGIGRLIGRAVRGTAARELGGAAEILADPHATAATRQEALRVANHYGLDEQHLVAMRDTVQSGASRAEASLPGGAATDATASARIAPAIQQEHNAAQHGYGVVDDAMSGATSSPGLRTNATGAATRAGMDQDPLVMNASRRLDAVTENASGRNPLQQYEAIRNVVSAVKKGARKADGLSQQGLNEVAQLGDRVKEMHIVSTLGTPEGQRMVNYARGSDAMWRDLKTTVENSDMLSAIGHGDARTSLGTALLNVVKIGHAGEDAALGAVNSINRITANSPAPRQAIQELYMREAFRGAHATPDIRTAANELLHGKSSGVARALLTPEQLTRVQHVADNAARYATKRKGEAGFESALMATEGATAAGHIVPGAGLLSAAFSLAQLRGNVRMYLRSLPPNYRDLLRGNTGSGVPAAVGGQAASAAAGALP